ncbi:hypothetical protein TrRE_jg10261 [Triparma retinervis]|uniref:Uncharacterized protein n=1 Tax=Triparma retinervis TaxID=2557542 RepID=A0A9W7G8J8_9STRA|nr:hypothetical protein TrRE_jg10261 [Triparma retinervis]
MARSKYRANSTSTWPANPITALREESSQIAILYPDAKGNGIPDGIGKRKLMPAGYNDKEGLCNVFVPSAPNVVNIKDQFMYRTSQERSLSQPFAPPPRQYIHNDPNVDRSKFNALDLVLERREKLKDEAKKLEKEISLRQSTYIPMDPPINDTLKFRPSSKAGFEKTVYRIRPGTKSRAMDMSVDKWEVDRRPISGRTHRVIVSNIIPGSSFSWSNGYKTSNQISGLG